MYLCRHLLFESGNKCYYKQTNKTRFETFMNDITNDTLVIIRPLYMIL